MILTLIVLIPNSDHDHDQVFFLPNPARPGPADLPESWSSRSYLGRVINHMSLTYSNNTKQLQCFPGF